MPKKLTAAEKKARIRAAAAAKKAAAAAKKVVAKEKAKTKDAEKKAKEKARKAALAEKRAAAAKRQTAPSKNSKTGVPYNYSSAADKKIKAKKPGKRVSKSGKVYYENRKNRSDINKWL